MKILHVGWGYTPFRGGGLIDYAEDLMEVQLKSGLNVSYFCTGKSSIFFKNSKIKHWKNKRGYDVYELQNPPILAGVELGVRHPLLDIHEPVTEKAFFEVVRNLRPTIIHFHEMVGLPSELIKKLSEAQIKTVFTVHDYFTLCPILKLVKTDGKRCRIKGVELNYECAKCCIDAPENNFFYKLKATFRDWLPKRRRKKFMSLLTGLKKGNTQGSSENIVSVRTNNGYYERRSKNLDHLTYFDKIIAVSNGVANVLNYYEEFSNMQVLHGTVKHISSIKGKVIRLQEGERVRLGLINVFGTNPLKGKSLILELFDLIEQSELRGRVQFIILGHMSPEDESTLKSNPFVTYYGTYNSKDLNDILDSLNIHVRIVPSLWDEAYGFVGIEFLAKGIPVIGSNIGGIPDYVINRETGWLNNSCSAAELLRIIRNLINDPVQIQYLNEHILKDRHKYVKDLNTHSIEVLGIYKEVLEKEKTS